MVMGITGIAKKYGRALLGDNSTTEMLQKLEDFAVKESQMAMSVTLTTVEGIGEPSLVLIPNQHTDFQP
jgi:hypothetical protein